jgi:hypothetical protein
MPNRPENGKKLPVKATIAPLKAFYSLSRTPSIFNGWLALFREIQAGLGGASKVGGRPLTGASHDTKSIGTLCRQADSRPL